MDALSYYNSGMYKKENSDPEGAIFDFTKAIEINPQFFKAYFYRGETIFWEFNEKSVEHAISDYSKAIEINPNYVEAYLNRARAKKHLKDLDGSLADHTKAIEINPKNAYLYYLRALFNKEVKNYSAAISDYKQCIKYYDPKEKNAHWCKESDCIKSIAYIRFELKDYPGTISDCSKAIALDKELDKELYTAYVLRGRAKFCLENYCEARVDYNLAISVGKNEDDYAYYHRAKLKDHLKDYVGAIEDYRKCIKEHSSRDAHLLMGIAYFKLEVFNKAIIQFTCEIKSGRETREAYYYRGLTLLKLGQKDEGCVDLMKAKELGHPKANQELINIGMQ